LGCTNTADRVAVQGPDCLESRAWSALSSNQSDDQLSESKAAHKLTQVKKRWMKIVLPYIVVVLTGKFSTSDFLADLITTNNTMKNELNIYVDNTIKFSNCNDNK